MASSYTQLTKQFIETKVCSHAASLLHAIVSGIIAGQRLDELQHVINIIYDAAFKKLDDYRQQVDHSPYYIATGMEANLMYIACEVNEGNDDDLRWSLAKLAYLAKKLEESDDILPVSDLEHVSRILDYCYHTFQCMTDKSKIIVIAIPDIDIDCVAAHTYSGSLPITIVNAKHFIAQLLDTFAYEAVAMIIAEGKDIPKDAINLMHETTAHDIYNLSKEKQYEYYLHSLKIGLAYNAPHGRSIVNGYNDKSCLGVWHEYLLNLKADQKG